MTKPRVDYFIVQGEMIVRGDDRFEELEAKYVQEYNEEEGVTNESETSKDTSK